MPTNKLGLPLLTGNETADIPRDFNALAEKIDEKAGSPDGLAQLDGNGKTPITQLPDASTSQKGATKLNDATNSTSTTEAATANAVRKVNDALVTHSADYMPHDSELNQYASGLDANGIYTVVDFKRKDGTLYMKSTATNPDANGNYQTFTWKFYKIDGTTLALTKTWTIIYNADGVPTSKVVA